MSAAVPITVPQQRPQLTLITGTTPRTAQDSELPSPSPQPKTGLITITFQVYKEHAPALRSAIEDISSEIGTRLEKGRYPFPLQDSLTNAAVAVGQLRAAVNAAIPADDPDYVPRSRR